MKKSIALRNTLKELVEETFPELCNHVSTLKLDTVESFPSASVYLGDLENARGATRGHVQRSQPITVMIWRSDDKNIEETFADNAEILEQAVYTARKTKLKDADSIYLTSASTDFPETGRPTRGALRLTFEVEFQNQLTT